MATAVVLSPISFSQESSQSVSYDRDEATIDHESTIEENDAISEETMEIEEHADMTTSPVVDNATPAEVVDDMDLAIDAILDDQEEDEDAVANCLESVAGIENLGNTCYAAASLQMLASAQSFIESIRDHDAIAQLTESKLRRGFLDIMDRLLMGKTVHIDDFKAIVDEQSPLFVGYDQQDAHEFITTLLDLIDLDCKKNKEESNGALETTEQAAMQEEEEVKVDCMDEDQPEHDDGNHVSSEEVACAMLCELSNGSAFKRPRTGEMGLDQFEENETCNPLSPLHTPWSALDNDGVAQLIYGSMSPATESQGIHRDAAYHDSACAQQPRCKLVGGRMNTEGISWEPYQPKLHESDMAADAPNRLQHHNSHSADSRDHAHSVATNETTEATKSSPVDSCFVMTCRVQMTCDSCKYTRTHNETYSHLSLEIGSESGSVEDGLRRFFAPEKLECKCEKCFAESATRTLEIVHLPECLLLHFKRFIVDISRDYSSISYRKNRSSVAFDEKLSFQKDSMLSEFLADDCDANDDMADESSTSATASYSLQSVINHIGSSASCGHYTADCKRLDRQTGDRPWYRFNDEHVQSVSAATAIEESQRTAYLVLYERQE